MRTIKLKSNGVGRYDDVSPFLVTDNKLEIAFELPNFSGDFYFVYENGTNKGRKLIPREGVVVLENLSAGELHAEVKHYARGELVKVYKVEPLLLREADGSLSAMPEIVELKAQIATLTGECAALHEENGTLAKALKQAKEEAHGELMRETEKLSQTFLNFAYFVYQNSPLLNGRGLTFEDFCEALKENQNLSEVL